MINGLLRAHRKVIHRRRIMKCLMDWLLEAHTAHYGGPGDAGGPAPLRKIHLLGEAPS